MTLVEFLLARLDDEEALAHDAASEGTPRRSGWQLWTSKVSTTPGGETVGPRGSVEASPARVLADIAAKRQIVGLWAEEWSDWHGFGSGLVRTRMTDDQYLRVLDAERVLGCLAQPYADHSDYDPTWAPR